MDAEDFFSRWSRRAAESKAAQAPAQVKPEQNAPVPPAQTAQAPAASIPATVPAKERPVTLEDVAALTKDSDYSPFVAKGIDETVKRSAMKKLFSDPHFNVMDGLDIYIDDYSVFEPLKPATLLALNHAQALLDPLKQIQGTMLSLLQESGKEETANGDQAGTGNELTDQQSVEQENGQTASQAAQQMEEGTNKDESLKGEDITDTPPENQTPAEIPDSTKPAER